MCKSNTMSLISVLLIISVASVRSQDDALKKLAILCKYDADCVDNAYCKDQSYCECKPNFIANISPSGVVACLKGATQIDDPCQEDIQCTKPFGLDAHCSSATGSCQCKPNAHFKEGRCYESIMLGGKCKVTNNCKIDSNISVFCDRSTCVCPQLYHPNSLNTDCLPSSLIGEPCISDEYCHVNNSRCQTVCRCQVNYIVSKDEQRCLKAAEKEGDHCEEDAQCSEFLNLMECIKSTCFCQRFHHFDPTTHLCWRSIDLGDTCSDSKECVVTSLNSNATVCVQNKCKCASGYVQDAGDVKNCVLRSGDSRLQISTSLSFLSLLLILISSKHIT